jgi:hypothetical protein
MLLLLDGLKVGRAVGSTVGAAVDGLQVGTTVGNRKTPSSLVLAVLIDSMLFVSFSPA